MIQERLHLGGDMKKINRDCENDGVRGEQLVEDGRMTVGYRTFAVFHGIAESETILDDVVVT